MDRLSWVGLEEENGAGGRGAYITLLSAVRGKAIWPKNAPLITLTDILRSASSSY
jgi:hypothetical protein